MARPLKIYMRGKSVRTLQQMLKQMGYPMEDQAAIFGASTRDAVKDFQKRKGLKVDGIVDDELFKVMQQNVGFQSDSGDKKDNKNDPVGLTSPANRQQLDALVGLLISKGVITEEELTEAMRPQPVKVTQPPLA